jgi:HSP20 family molecular chaperone IbpA
MTAAAPTLPVREPVVDIWSDASQVMLVAELPGASRDGLQLTLDRRMLTLEATAPTHRFQRTFSVGMEVEEEGMRAELHNGVLTVHLPRASRDRARQIPVIEA